MFQWLYSQPGRNGNERQHQTQHNTNQGHNRSAMRLMHRRKILEELDKHGMSPPITREGLRGKRQKELPMQADRFLPTLEIHTNLSYEISVTCLTAGQFEVLNQRSYSMKVTPHQIKMGASVVL